MAKQRRARLRPASSKPSAPASIVPTPPPLNARAPAVTSDGRQAGAEALALYERGLQALQRREYTGASRVFRALLEDHPDERELHDRARVYLKVCERQLHPPAPLPATANERLYAATLALNAGDHEEALAHLMAADRQDPENDYCHYMLAVVHALRGDPERAVLHLARAVALNPDNRAHARQEPEFQSLRGLDGFRRALDTPGSTRRRTHGRAR